jgi:hypothetical protein
LTDSDWACLEITLRSRWNHWQRFANRSVRTRKHVEHEWTWRKIVSTARAKAIWDCRSMQGSRQSQICCDLMSLNTSVSVAKKCFISSNQSIKLYFFKIEGIRKCHPLPGSARAYIYQELDDQHYHPWVIRSKSHGFCDTDMDSGASSFSHILSRPVANLLFKAHETLLLLVDLACRQYRINGRNHNLLVKFGVSEELSEFVICSYLRGRLPIDRNIFLTLQVLRFRSLFNCPCQKERHRFSETINSWFPAGSRIPWSLTRDHVKDVSFQFSCNITFLTW